MSFTAHKRQHSEASLPSVGTCGDSWGTGSLRLRKDKVRCKMAAIPKMEFGGVSPLKQLQRMKEDETLATLPRSTPNIKFQPVNYSLNVNEVHDTSASSDPGCPSNGNESVTDSTDHPWILRSDTNGNMRTVGDNRMETDGGASHDEDVNANCVIAGDDAPRADSMATDSANTYTCHDLVVNEDLLTQPETPKRKQPPDVSPRHSSLIKTHAFPGLTDLIPSPASSPGEPVLTVPMPTIDVFPASPTKKHPPPLLPKPKPKIIVKLVRDDPELRASHEKLTRTASDASGRVTAAFKATERRAPASEASSDVANTEDLNDSLRDLRIPSRNSGLYSSFKDVRGSSNTSLNMRSSNTSPSTSVRDVNHKGSMPAEDAYIRVESPTSKYTHLPLQETVVIRRDRPASITAKEKRLSKSAEELDKAALALLDLTGPYLTPRSRLRSSLTEGKDDIYHSIGDVQTLLKCNMSEEERIYSLPQPQCYGDSTLKAVKEITEKYDTLQRRKLRALSFRENGRYEKNSLPSADTSHPICGDLAVGPDDAFMPTSKPDGPKKYGSGVTARDVTRLDLFYRSYGTEVYVCRCLCDLSFTTPPPNSEELTNWEPVKSTGIPVLILNTGAGKRRRELFFILAERETGFSLWKDKINYLSNYREYKPAVHVMQMSNNLRRVAGFRFYSREIAEEFMADFRSVTRDPNDDIWKISNPRKQPKKQRWGLRRSKSKKGPKKTDISQPCHFVHVTYVDANDAKDCMHDLATGSDSPVFRQRLSTT